jgi:hypothetical protein
MGERLDALRAWARDKTVFADGRPAGQVRQMTAAL